MNRKQMATQFKIAAEKSAAAAEAYAYVASLAPAEANELLEKAYQAYTGMIIAQSRDVFAQWANKENSKQAAIAAKRAAYRAFNNVILSHKQTQSKSVSMADAFKAAGS